MSRAKQLSVAVLLSLFAGAVPAQRISLVDRIVAVVNNEVVTLSELNERVATAESSLRRQKTPLPERGSFS